MDSIRKKLACYSELGMYSFHTPGHKGRGDILSELVFPDYDLTELPELDMLHNPQGIIAGAQEKTADYYGAAETYFLVNGATSGNQAMFMALSNGTEGKRIRITRNAHRSVFGALVLSGLTPEYVSPIIHPDFNLPLGIDLEEYTKDMETVGAFHLTNPSYYGSVVDLASVIKTRDNCHPDIPILVDQAHGSHFIGEYFPGHAVGQGADLVVHSTHKTMAALTQAAMLHVRGSRVDRSLLRRSLELLQTSSPNYLLMSSLENAVANLDKMQWEEIYQEVTVLQKELGSTLRILTAKDIGSYGIKDLDWSKILVNVSALGIGAPEAVRILRSSFRIEPELWDERNILFLLGVGSRAIEIRHLREALASIAGRYLTQNSKQGDKGGIPKEGIGGKLEIPPMQLTPREAWLTPTKVLRVKDSLGRIAGETISIYPPGIPLIVAGEEITPDVQAYLTCAEEYKWQGWEGFKQGQILVIDI